MVKASVKGTSSQGAKVNVNNDYHAAARAEQQRQHDQRVRQDELTRQAERRQSEQRQAEQRQAEARRESERQQSERRQAEQRQAEQRYAEQQRQQEQQRQRDAQQRASSGGTGGPPPPPPPPSGGGGPPPNNNDPLKGFSGDMRNLADRQAKVDRYPTNPLNEAGKKRYGAEYIQEYKSNDHLYRTRSNPNPDPSKPVAQFHQDGVHTRWHASIQEMERKSQIRFNAASYNDIGQSMKQYLDLPQAPTHSSYAHLRGTPTDVNLSYTKSGKQQAEVRSEHMSYSGTKPIGELFSWLKFKPSVK